MSKIPGISGLHLTFAECLFLERVELEKEVGQEYCLLVRRRKAMNIPPVMVAMAPVVEVYVLEEAAPVIALVVVVTVVVLVVDSEVATLALVVGFGLVEEGQLGLSLRDHHRRLGRCYRRWIPLVRRRRR